jgi:hypothetical protein
LGKAAREVMSTGVGLAERRLDPERFDHPVLADVHDYWKAKCADRAMPSRREILPNELRDYLGWIVLLDVLPGLDDFRYRLVGTLVSRYFYFDSTGKTIREAFAAWPKATIDSVIAVHRNCARDKTVLHLVGKNNWMGQVYEDFESLYLPLSDDGILCNVILNVFVFDRAKVLLNRATAKANNEPQAQIPPNAIGLS